MFIKIYTERINTKAQRDDFADRIKEVVEQHPAAEVTFATERMMTGKGEGELWGTAFILDRYLDEEG